MPFVERVVEHVRRVRQVEEGTAQDKRVVIDYGRHRTHARRMLEAAEEQAPASWAERRGREERWLAGWRLDCFVEELHWAIVAGWGADLGLEERSALVDLGIMYAAQLPSSSVVSAPMRDSVPFHARAQLLCATAVELWDDVNERLGAVVASTWPRVTRYCAEVGLVGEREGLWSASEMGTVLLKLRGRDAVKWLLTLEAQGAVGDDDPWRVSVERLSELRTRGGVDRDHLDRDDEGAHAWLHHLERLTAMGVVETTEGEDGAPVRWGVSGLGAEVIDEVMRGEGSPFGVMGRAMREDHVDAVVGSVGSRAMAGSEKSEHSFRHARMVAHEVRNALGPVQHASRKLRGELGAGAGSASVLEHLDAIDRGVSRLYRFVTESVRLLPPESRRVEPFSVLEAIDEARKELGSEGIGSLSIRALPASADPRCRGSRGQFVMAVLNVLRNAQQAAGDEVQIFIRVDARRAGEIHLTIEDDGPGVPDAVRERIFENGVSYRRDGTGHGLASLRAVVEDLGGTVGCTTGERGGARFEIVLPATEGSP